jgi:hypothetical protein
MFHKLKPSLLLLLSLPALISAERRLQNSIDAAAVTPETRTGLCKPQGENDWTFAMRLSELVVPTFDSEYMWEASFRTRALLYTTMPACLAACTPGAMTAGPHT